MSLAIAALSESEALMKNIYVGNLSFDATEDQVRAYSRRMDQSKG